MSESEEKPSNPTPSIAAAVERLFPFVLRSRGLLVGRETLQRSKSQLHFVLITTDVSDNSRSEILAAFAHYPVVQCYSSADLEKFFALKGTKVVGFKKSGLAQSIYAELKSHRINRPPPAQLPKTPASPPPSGKPTKAKQPAAPTENGS